MVYKFAPNYKLHQFDDEIDESVNEISQLSIPEKNYVLPRGQIRSFEGFYQGGLRSQGMNSGSYLESISKSRGYHAPERSKGEYKDHEKNGGGLGGATMTLSSMRGLR